MQGKNIADAQVKTAPAVYNGKDAVCAVAVTYQGRQLTVRTDEADVDGCISYTNNTRVGLGTVSIRGMRDFYGTVSAARSRSVSTGRRPLVRKTTASR